MAIGFQVPRLWLMLRRLLNFEQAPIDPNFSETIHGVINLNRYFHDAEIGAVTRNISAPYGDFISYWTLSDTEEIHLKFCYRHATNGDTQVIIRDEKGNMCPVAPLSGLAAGYILDLLLDPGWSIGMLTSGNVADTSVSLKIIYEKTEAF